MATITTCDGNGTEIPADTPTTGPFGHQYSDAMRPIAEKYLVDLNDLHTQLAAAFKAGLEDLRNQYREKLRELPDAP